MAFTLWFHVVVQVFCGIVEVEEGKEGEMVVDSGTMKQPTVLALATCHALVVVDNKMVQILPPVHIHHTFPPLILYPVCPARWETLWRRLPWKEWIGTSRQRRRPFLASKEWWEWEWVWDAFWMWMLLPRRYSPCSLCGRGVGSSRELYLPPPFWERRTSF